MSKPAGAPSKRQRFSAGAITASTSTRSNELGDGSELVATIRRWGSTFGVFEDGSRTEALWQLQITHGGRQSFGYQLLGVCREALQQHPNENVRDPLHLETEMHIRILSGAPPQTGHPDPDGVGLEAWLPVVYAPTPADGMNIVHFIMKHKISAGQVLQMPHLIALFPAEQPTEVPTVPVPWVVQPKHTLQMKPFNALPPRGRRHVLMQVELADVLPTQGSPPANHEAADSEDEQTQKNDLPISTYAIMFFGSLYSFRELFDAANIQGGTVPRPDGTKDEYVRHMKATYSDDDKQKLKTILEQVLLKVPVYLIDHTESRDDPLVSWMLTQPSVHLGERSGESA